MSISKCSPVYLGKFLFFWKQSYLKSPFFPETKFDVTWIDVVSEKGRTAMPNEPPGGISRLRHRLPHGV